MFLLGGCAMPIALNPQGPAAAEMAFLWWVLFWTATVVSIIVFALLFFAVRKARRGEEVEWQESRSTAFVVVGGGIIPAIILIAMLFITLGSMRVFDTPPNPASLTINVTGHMFWWEATYEGEGFTTANEIHIPVGEPVRINLESADVIHSFWVPQLHGKIEMVPGWTNTMYLEADEPGSYFGKCAEFCGIQHANMEFLVIAQERPDYDAWAEHQRQPAREPFDELTRLGQQVFLGSACVYCHTVRGTTASGRLGPDLTHLASRMTLGARMLENNRGNLAGWTVNAQAIKPGNRMPPMYMEPEALQALLAYMEMLE
jgi:cytochrome c oxidase subunit II